MLLRRALSVLILVLVEYALGVKGILMYSTLIYWVLILVLVEYALGAVSVVVGAALPRLNPCFSGICSRRTDEKSSTCAVIGVLILVLVEYALGAFIRPYDD